MITMDTFQEGDVFKLFYEGENFIQLTLTNIKKSKFQIKNTDRKSFSLMFKGPKDIYIEQGIHDLVHESVGTVEIGLVLVIAPYGEGNFHFYEAVFS